MATSPPAHRDACRRFYATCAFSEGRHLSVKSWPILQSPFFEYVPHPLAATASCCNHPHICPSREGRALTSAQVPASLLSPQRSRLRAVDHGPERRALLTVPAQGSHLAVPGGVAVLGQPRSGRCSRRFTVNLFQPAAAACQLVWQRGEVRGSRGRARCVHQPWSATRLKRQGSPNSRANCGAMVLAWRYLSSYPSGSA